MKPQAQSYMCDLVPYVPGKSIEALAREYQLDPATIVKLASNENPLGMSPKARQALQRGLDKLHRYPEQHDLLQALAAHYGVDIRHIVLGNGSNDVLDLVARTYLNDGDEAISSQYAFAVYQIATQSAGAKNVVVDEQNYTHDLAALQRAITPKTKLIWIANPNNPTGTFVPNAEVKVFLERVPPHIIVVLDEAYYEYLAPESQGETLGWLAEHPNLVVVRTFSKIYGLAGLRVGYAVAAPEVAEVVNRVRQPFNASTAAIMAATAALGDTTFVAKSAAHNQRSRNELQHGLARHNLVCLPAHGNFITFETPQAAALCEFLLRRGVIVRPLTSYGLRAHIRVTAGTAAENNRFLAALDEWYSKDL